MFAPCKDCADRSAECHGKCEKYAEFASMRERLRDIKNAESELMVIRPGLRRNLQRRKNPLRRRGNAD